MSEEAYSYLKSLAAMYLEHGGKYHKGIVAGYLFALLDFNVITTKDYFDWCDYMKGESGCPLAS